MPGRSPVHHHQRRRRSGKHLKERDCLVVYLPITALDSHCHGLGESVSALREGTYSVCKHHLRLRLLRLFLVKGDSHPLTELIPVMPNLLFKLLRVRIRKQRRLRRNRHIGNEFVSSVGTPRFGCKVFKHQGHPTATLPPYTSKTIGHDRKREREAEPFEPSWKIGNPG